MFKSGNVAKAINLSAPKDGSSLPSNMFKSFQEVSHQVPSTMNVCNFMFTCSFCL